MKTRRIICKSHKNADRKIILDHVQIGVGYEYIRLKNTEILQSYPDLFDLAYERS